MTGKRTDKQIDKKIDKKRQEQNRMAQKVFRERNQLKVNELKQKLQELEEMKEIYEQANVKELMDLRRENNTLKQQRLVMIFQIDRLRQDNVSLTTRSHTRTRLTPRQQLPVKGMPSLPLPWTSHKHTFVESSSCSNHDSSSSTRSLDEKQWQESHQYPGFPQWAPPSITHKYLLPQPPPLHLSTREPLQPPSIPTPQMEMFNQVIQNYGGGSRPLQSTTKPAQNLEPFFMPFLPSTNAMVPLYHHMPFESSVQSSGMMIDNLNDWWDDTQLDMPLVSRDMAFEPLEVMLSSAISNPIPNQIMDPESQSISGLGDGLDCNLADISNLMATGSLSIGNGCHSRISTANTMTAMPGNDFGLLQGQSLDFQDIAISHQLAMDEAAKIRLANVFLPL
jgi:hypothetical protein